MAENSGRHNSKGTEGVCKENKLQIETFKRSWFESKLSFFLASEALPHNGAGREPGRGVKPPASPKVQYDPIVSPQDFIPESFLLLNFFDDQPSLGDVQ